MNKRFTVIMVWILVVSLLVISNPVMADTEPNDSIYEATDITLNQVVNGTMDEFADDYDYFNITLQAGYEFLIELDGPDDADYDLHLLDSDGIQLAGGYWDLDADEAITYTTTETDYYYVKIWAYSGNGPYTLEVSVTQSYVESYTLSEAENAGYIEVTIRGVYAGSEDSFTLDNGNGVIYGQCLEIDIENLLSYDLNITIPAGQVLNSDDNTVEDKVVTRTVSVYVDVGAQESSFIYAMSVDMTKYVPNRFSYYTVGHNASGNLRKVVNQINATDEQTAVGQIAVWMITDDDNMDKLDDLDASQPEIDEAEQILKDVGLEPPTKNDGTGDGGVWVCLILLIILVILLVFVVLVKRATPRRETPQYPPPNYEYQYPPPGQGSPPPQPYYPPPQEPSYPPPDEPPFPPPDEPPPPEPDPLPPPESTQKVRPVIHEQQDQP